MKKRELAQAVAAHTEVDPRVAAKVIDGTLEVILATVAKGEDVALTGFAKFSKVKRPARMARNPATGEAVKVKAKTVAKITPLKGFKDVVLGVATAPKLTKPKPAAVKKTAYREEGGGHHEQGSSDPEEGGGHRDATQDRCCDRQDDKPDGDGGPPGERHRVDTSGDTPDVAPQRRTHSFDHVDTGSASGGSFSHTRTTSAHGNRCT